MIPFNVSYIITHIYLLFYIIRVNKTTSEPNASYTNDVNTEVAVNAKINTPTGTAELGMFEVVY